MKIFNQFIIKKATKLERKIALTSPDSIKSRFLELKLRDLRIKYKNILNPGVGITINSREGGIIRNGEQLIGVIRTDKNEEALKRAYRNQGQECPILILFDRYGKWTNRFGKTITDDILFFEPSDKFK